VGEWARVLALSRLIPAKWGPNFHPAQIARALYRKVLARYVQMATEGGRDPSDSFPKAG